MHLNDKQTVRGRMQRGFSLVEVLIALIIMSVGMLGIAGLYVQSMQAGRTSTLRHNAVTLAGDVADRIRSNPTAGAAYAGGGTDNDCVDKDTDCTPAEMAGHDIFLWSEQATSSMPSGAVTITFNGVVPAEYTIAITWDEPGELATDPLNYTVTIPVSGT